MNYGRYQVIEELGRGSMGIVYKAHDPQIDRYVALKVLREDRVEAEGFVQRFLKEARAMGWLSHPNIVTIYDVGEDHGTVYIAMELLDGESLNKVIERRRFSVGEIISLGAEVALTLDHAHRKGIVHRDIKPSNIVLIADRSVKVTDFGIAHIGGAAGAQQTQAGEILGTPAYMSPEQIMGKSVDGRSDLFSLGIVLYEICTGTRPFTGDNLAAIFHAIVESEPPDPSKLNPDIPQELAKVVMKCLRKRPEERFERGEALASALEGCVLSTQKQTVTVSTSDQR
ncbi:MAG: serine/threonine-protein kinase, partial [Chloroflexota bacterium]